MGLGFHAVAKPGFSLLRGRPDRDKTFHDILQAFRQHAETDPWRARFSLFQRHDDALDLWLHPVDGVVRFEFNNDGHPVAHARTTHAGPGFHAAAIDLLDFLQTHCGLHWDWHNADDTGYATHRDFPRLQETMAHWSLTFFKEAVALMKPDATAIRLNLSPLAPACDLPSHFLTPTGPMNFASVRDAMTADPARALRLATRVFPWWDRQLTPHVLKATALSLMWTAVPWRPPMDGVERRAMQTAHDCLTAYNAQAAQPLCLPELAEIQRALQSDPQATIAEPATTGVGYRRQTCLWPIGCGWSIKLPGWWHAQVNDPGDTLLFQLGARELHFTVIDIGKPLSPMTPQQMLESSLRLAPGPEGRQARFQCGPLAGQITVGVSHEKPGLMQATAKIADTDSILVANGYFTRRDTLEWVTRALASIRHQRAPQAQAV